MSIRSRSAVNGAHGPNCLVEIIVSRVPVKAHKLEKPLQATVIRSMLRVARELARQMRKVHRAPVREPNQQHSQSFKPCLAQAKMRT